MSIKEIWLASLRLYRKSLLQVWHLFFVIGIIVTTSLYINVNVTDKVNGFNINVINLVAILALSLLFVYISSLTLLKMYNIKNERDISWGNAISYINKKFIKIVITMVIVLAINSLGMLVLIIPGILAFVLFSMAQPLVLLDNQGIIESIKNSCKLVWGKWWHTFIILLPLITINYWIGFSISYGTRYSIWHMVISGVILSILFYPVFFSCILTIFDDLKSHQASLQTIKPI